MTHPRIAAVKMAAKAVGLTIDDDYRAFLKSRVGVTSCKDLNGAQFRTLMEEFRKLGREPRKPRPVKEPTFLDVRVAYWQARLGYRPGMASPEQMGLIEELWERIRRSPEREKSLRQWLLKWHKVGDITWIDDKKAPKIIEAEKRMAARR
jgi:hypothetical protein